MGALAKRRQLKRLIRYIKRWRDVNFSSEGVRQKVFSIALTIMVKEQYKPSVFSDEIKDDLVALKSTINEILDSNYIVELWSEKGYRVHTKLPKKPYRDVFQHKENSVNVDGSDLNTGMQLKNKLTTLKNNLQKAIDEPNEIKQCEILNQVFGDDFEIPKKNNKSSISNSTLAISPMSNAGASGTSQGA